MLLAVANAAALATLCSPQVNRDQTGGTVISGEPRQPGGFNNQSTAANCCAACKEYTGGKERCTTWVWQPSTTHCWFIAHATGTTSREDRVVGGAPAPPPPPPPPPPHTIWVTQYGTDTLRLRIGFGINPIATPIGAVLPNPLGPAAKTISWTTSSTAVVNIENGALRASISSGGMVVFAGAGAEPLLTLASVAISESTSTGNITGYYSMSTTWLSEKSEKLWGMGERATKTLNLKGEQISFENDQTNTHWTVPFLISSKQYGMFWNHPGWGGVDMTNDNTTVWSAIAAKQLDVFIYAPSATTQSKVSPYADLTTRYYESIGMPSRLPEWALGLWASKQRYTSVQEIEAVISNYTVTHGIPVEVLVIDWKHYECVGDWGFTVAPKTCWDDVPAMVQRLAEKYNVSQIFISVHPWAQNGSANYDALQEQKLCTHNRVGQPLQWGGWGLECKSVALNNCLYDASSSKAREFLWSKLKSGYYDLNITNFWTDGTEPAGGPKNKLPLDVTFTEQNIPGAAAWMMWPVWHASTVYNGAISAGAKPDSTWTLARSAWAGSHRLNQIVWSGDISSDWSTLSDQVHVGLNAMLTVPYWNSDTGGFKGGDFQTMGELQARWFQFSIWTSITRLHGSRTPKEPQLIPFEKTCDPSGAAGGPIEPWVYSDEALQSIKEALQLKQSIRPYIRTLVDELATRGTPTMRPLWFDFPKDINATLVSDQIMFGSDLMIAPITQARKQGNSRKIYFPRGATYVDHFTKKSFQGGSSTEYALGLDAKLNEFPLFNVQRTA